MNSFSKNLSDWVDKIWTDLDGFRQTTIQFKEQSCVQQFEECMMDLMKMRPPGFAIETLVPSSPHYSIQPETNENDDTT